MLKRIITKPHLFFFGLAVSFIVLGIINRDTSFDLNIGDTYFVSTIDFWFYFSAIFFTLIGLNYFSLVWAEKPPKKWLTITHIIFQILSLLFLMTKHHWNWFGSQNQRELDLLNKNSETVFIISIVLFIASIFIHLLNFFVPLFLKKK